MNIEGLFYEGLPISKIHVCLDVEPTNVFKYLVETLSYVEKKEFEKTLKAFDGFEFEGLVVLNRNITFVFRREFEPKKGDIEYVLKKLDLFCPTAIITLRSMEIVTCRLSDDVINKVLKILEENGIEAKYKHGTKETIFFAKIG